jgi:peptidoglycan-N-acetylglucosamine deacetylase
VPQRCGIGFRAVPWQPPDDRAERPQWLGGSAALASLTFDVDAEVLPLSFDRDAARRASLMSHQSYGPRVGVPRLMALLAEYGITGTFFIPGVTAERYPWLVELLLARGHEVAHHSHAHRAPSELTADEERADFERGLAALASFGAAPVGHRAAALSASWATAAIVAEHGLLYDSSLMHDDRPYVLATAAGDVIELPTHWILDDYEQYGYVEGLSDYLRPPDTAFALWSSELDGMRRHGGHFVLVSHPFLSGRPSRVENLRRLIDHALAAGDVEFVSMAEAARRAQADPGLARIEHQPFDVDERIFPAGAGRT